MIRKAVFAAALAALFAAGSAVSQTPAQPDDPRAFASSIGTTSYLLLIDGKPVASFGDVAHAYRLHSVRKSILSALVGIEIGKGVLKLDTTLNQLGISDRNPLTPQEGSATLAHLLNSNSGVFRPATYENAGFDKIRPAAGSAAPGTHWFYSNWDFNVVGTVFQQETGHSICGAFLSNLAAPLGLRDTGPETCGWRYSTRSRHPAYVFRMSARDLASFGDMMRQGGRANGRQIVPKNWVRKSTGPLSLVGDAPNGKPLPGISYGYMWWTAEKGTQHFPGLGLDLGSRAFIASGTGTQLLVVAPARKLVFVHLTDTEKPDGKAVSQDDIGRLLAMLLAGRNLPRQ